MRYHGCGGTLGQVSGTVGEGSCVSGLGYMVKWDTMVVGVNIYV